MASDHLLCKQLNWKLRLIKTLSGPFYFLLLVSAAKTNLVSYFGFMAGCPTSAPEENGIHAIFALKMTE